MKIISPILFLLIVLFIAQPLISSRREAAAVCCPVTMKCQAPDHSAENGKKCPCEGCNAFLSCSFGLFTIEGYEFYFTAIVFNRVHPAAANDNRLSSLTLKNWHPPERPGVPC